VKREWAVRHRITDVVSPRADRLDAQNSARLDSNLQVVTREVSGWQEDRAQWPPSERWRQSLDPATRAFYDSVNPESSDSGSAS